jgi:hypothetical protein
MLENEHSLYFCELLSVFSSVDLIDNCYIVLNSFFEKMFLRKVPEMQNSSKIHFRFFYIWLDRARRAE